MFLPNFYSISILFTTFRCVLLVVSKYSRAIRTLFNQNKELRPEHVKFVKEITIQTKLVSQDAIRIQSVYRDTLVCSNIYLFRRFGEQRVGWRGKVLEIVSRSRFIRSQRKSIFAATSTDSEDAAPVLEVAGDVTALLDVVDDGLVRGRGRGAAVVHWARPSVPQGFQVGSQPDAVAELSILDYMVWNIVYMIIIN